MVAAGKGKKSKSATPLSVSAAEGTSLGTERKEGDETPLYALTGQGGPHWRLYKKVRLASSEADRTMTTGRHEVEKGEWPLLRPQTLLAARVRQGTWLGSKGWANPGFLWLPLGVRPAVDPAHHPMACDKDVGACTGACMPHTPWFAPLPLVLPTSLFPLVT